MSFFAMAVAIRTPGQAVRNLVLSVAMLDVVLSMTKIICLGDTITFGIVSGMVWKGNQYRIVGK